MRLLSETETASVSGGDEETIVVTARRRQPGLPDVFYPSQYIAVSAVAERVNRTEDFDEQEVMPTANELAEVVAETLDAEAVQDVGVEIVPIQFRPPGEQQIWGGDLGDVPGDPTVDPFPELMVSWDRDDGVFRLYVDSNGDNMYDRRATLPI